MPVTDQPESVEIKSRKALRERQQTARRVYLDPSTPSVRSIVRVVIITLILLFIAGFVQSVISSLTYLFFLIVLSVFFAYLIDPLVRLIRRPFKERNLDRLMPRAAAIVVAYLFVFAVMAAAIANIAPSVGEQARDFGASLPRYGAAIQERANDLNRRFDRLRVPDEVQGEINKKITDAGGTITTAVGNFLLISLSYLPWLLLVPILAFFFLKDANLFRLSILRMFPAGRWRARAESVMTDVNTTLAAYTRAQILSCLLIGLICTVGFYAIGLRYALLLGILAGIFEFVPLLGPAAIGLIVILTAAGSDDPWNALYAAIFLVLLRVIHDYVTYPRIVRGGIHLHPLAVILAVLAGEQVAGIPGVFIAIPIVAVATVLYRHVLEHQGRRGLLSGWIEESEAKGVEEAAQ
ncbi:MAG TPA: AI-2E family transporter [Pyrinomonadaceae bacterium]|nr:AI-2E family transporter [Pyrinomonadaceae bacterium]